MNLKNIGEYPKTMNEAVSKLMVILSDQEKAQIKALSKNDLCLLHFSLGKDIRNAFGLNHDNFELLTGRSADDVSMEIIERLRLNLL